MTEEEAKAWLLARVSRETMDRLQLMHELLVKWQNTINLVAPSSLRAPWSRHFADSAQLFDLADQATTSWLDIGSGAGFPGLVIAAIAADQRTNMRFTLIESDVRKCGFLREAARIMDLDVRIHSCRIADAPHDIADVISARALAGLKDLINHAAGRMHSRTTLLFPKGAKYKDELEALETGWQNTTQIHPSVTDPTAVILRIQMPNPRKNN